MSGITARVTNGAEFKREMAKAESKVRKAAEEAVAKGTDEIHDDAQRLAPVDTGKLRRGIHAEVTGLDGTVKSTARHSEFVEHGTYKDKAQPFMKPAADLARRRIPAAATKIIKSFLEGL